MSIHTVWAVPSISKQIQNEFVGGRIEQFFPVSREKKMISDSKANLIKRTFKGRK